MHRLAIVSGAFVVALLTVPSPAYALKWLAWFEELSGPGPYRGPGITADIGCIASRLSPKEDFALLAYTYRRIKGGDPVQAFELIAAEIDKEPGSSNDDKLTNFLERLRRMAASGSPNAAPAATRDQLGIEPLLQRDTLLDGAFWIEYEKNQNRFSRCRADRSNNLFSVNLDLDVVRDTVKDQRGDGQEYAGSTRLVSMSIVGYFPIGRIGQLGSLLRLKKPAWHEEVPAWARTIEIGAGAGAYGLTGTTLGKIDMWRGTIPLRARAFPIEAVVQLASHLKGHANRPTGLDVSLPPESKHARWRRLGQAVEFRYGQDLVIGTIDSTLYSPAGPRTADEKNEWIESYGATLNLGMVYRAIFKR